MCDLKSSGKVKGKLVVPLSTLHRPGLGSSKPPPAFPLSASGMERELPQGCEQVGSQSVQPTDGWVPDHSWQSVSTSPQTFKRREREKEKDAWGRGRQPGITPSPCPPNLPPKAQSSAAGSRGFSRGRESWRLPAGSSTNASYKLKVLTVLKRKTATPPPSSLPPGPPSSSSTFTLLPTPSPCCTPHLCPATGAHTHPCATPRWGLIPQALQSGTQLIPPSSPPTCSQKYPARSVFIPDCWQVPVPPKAPVSLRSALLSLISPCCSVPPTLSLSSMINPASPPPALFGDSCLVPPEKSWIQPLSASCSSGWGLLPQGIWSPSPPLPTFAPPKGDSAVLHPDFCPVSSSVSHSSVTAASRARASQALQPHQGNPRGSFIIIHLSVSA